ncbi:MAG: MFS transporter [Christensenellales bacterium]
MGKRDSNKKRTITPAQKWGLGLGDLGYSLIANTLASYILFFGNTVMGVPGTVMGAAISVGTVWDAITDPAQGFISDNTRNKFFGRRHLYILIGLIGMVIGNIFLWAVPQSFPIWAKFVWFLFFMLLMKTFFTLFSTPNNALSLEISYDYDERSSIQIFKGIFTILGLLLPTVLMVLFQKPTAEISDGRLNPQSYVNFSYFTSAAAIVFCTYMFIITFSHVPRLRELAKKEKEQEGGFKQGFIRIFKNFGGALKDKNFRAVAIGFAVSMFAASVIIAVGFNVFTFTFNTSNIQMYIIMAGLFVMTIVGQPLWMKISKKYDKKKALIIGQIISLVGCLMLGVMLALRTPINNLLAQNKAAVIVMMPPLMVAGLGTGVLYSLPVALIGDVTIVEKLKRGEDKTATYSGFLTFSNKTGQALAQVVLGVCLDLIKFVPGSQTQTEAVKISLGWLMFGGCTLAVIAGLLIFSTFKLKRPYVEKALDELGDGLKEEVQKS